MSKFTTELRFVCETMANQSESQPLSKVDDIIEVARPQIFNFYYPIFDESYRAALETKIIRHYYTRELSEETVGLWRLRLQDKMNLIMPYYNKMYESELLKFNPLHDVDVTTQRTVEDNGTNNLDAEHSRTVAGTRTRRDDGTDMETSQHNNTHSDTDWDLYSDTPQGGILGIEGKGNGHPEGTIAADTYLSNARKQTNNGQAQDTNTRNRTTVDVTNENYQNTDNGTNSADTTIHNLQDYEERIFGKRNSMTYSQMVLEFRKTFLNIDAMIIEELSTLFFGLWE